MNRLRFWWADRESLRLRGRNAMRRFICHRLRGGHQLGPLTIDGPRFFGLVETVTIWTRCRGFCRQSFYISATMSLPEKYSFVGSTNELWTLKCDQAIKDMKASLPGYELASGPMPWRGQQ